MPDVVATCPQRSWAEWLAEGDCAGERTTGEEYAWLTGAMLAGKAKPGDRLYIVAFGRLRGWAPIVRVEHEALSLGYHQYSIVRAARAVACTLEAPVPGFRGLRRRWWDRADELPFPDWRTP